jgi:Na+-transporting methylmalonyl-CoA/oxaloacetate decarboxylase gamma subunit
MENQINWPEVLRIMGTGFGAVCFIMVLLALVTTAVGKVLQSLDKQDANKDGPA